MQKAALKIAPSHSSGETAWILRCLHAHGFQSSLSIAYGWGSSTICNILEKREYLGHTINFKTRKHFKDKKSH